MFQTKFVEKIKIHILCSITFENCAVYEIMWKNIVEPIRPQMTTLRMRTAHWIPTATNTQICFYGATIFTRPRLNVTSYVQCLSLVWSCRSWRTAAGGHCEGTNAGHGTTGKTCFAQYCKSGHFLRIANMLQ